MATGNFFRWAGRWLVIASLGFAVLSFAPSPASAEPPARPGPARDEGPVAARVRIGITSVYANNSGQVDPQLRDLQRQLAALKFTGFEVLSTHSDQLGESQSTTFALEAGHRMRVTLIDRNETEAKIRIELTKNDQKKLDTTISIKRDRTMIVGGPSYQEGKLIFPVSVSY